MSFEQNLPYLSTDLILQIISRLPSKSVARCRCLSKLWASLLTSNSPYFTELFLTQSKTRPRLFFAVHKNDHKWHIYSSQQPQNSYKDSKSPSLTVTAEFHTSIPETWFFSHPVSGLIYCLKMQNSRSSNYSLISLICNPSTGKISWLPNLRTRQKWLRNFFGYDSIHKKFSVLSISFSLPFRDEFPSNFQILNLRSGELCWRNLTCPLQHTPCYGFSTCIDGVLYYIARLRSAYGEIKIACFDLQSEEFKFIDQSWSYYDEPIFLVNFKGKLCAITMMWIEFDDSERSNVALSLWILEDFEKQEWSKHVYLLPSKLRSQEHEETHVSLLGVSGRGDIVLSSILRNSYYVYFCNPEKNSLQEVEVKGLDEDFKSIEFYGFVDYVEELRDPRI